jgi:hypothetical protein
MVKHSSLLCQVHSLLGRLQALTAKLNFGKKYPDEETLYLSMPS